ncbi:MAG: hypothetical protein LBC95_03110 [Candidatus Nomurabacteria bacterium]|jgi:hypothetical protein|nr:hypothetical protein [Candidatus Nomurabacteria bacterium]
MNRVKICVTVPVENADEIRQVLGEAGAGVIGEYSFCSVSYPAEGRFLASDKANPTLGEKGQIETVDEEMIEVQCDRTIAREVIAKLRAAHPYEEPAIDIYQLTQEEDL